MVWSRTEGSQGEVEDLDGVTVGERCSGMWRGEVAGLVTDLAGWEGARLMTGLVGVGGTGLLTDLGRECGGAGLETVLAVEVRTAGGT